MKILFFSSQLLFRDTRFGGAKRLYNFARDLEKRHDLRIICVDGCGEYGSLPADTGFKRYLALPQATEKPGTERWTRLALDIRGGLERERKAVEEFLAGEKFDAIVSAYHFGISFLDVFLQDHSGPIVFMEDDLQLEYARRRIDGVANPLRRQVRRLRYLQAVRLYARVLRRVKKFAGISPQEIGIMKRHFPWLETHLLSYGIELDAHPLLPPQSPLLFGFIGNYRHLPNAEALAWLLASVWPALKRGLPGARLRIAGTGIPAALKQAHGGDADVEWMENVPELAGFYREIGIFLNPVISGRGMRTKMIEAAAFGRPLVSTPLGAEGLESLLMETAASPDEFVAACRRLAADDGLRTSMAARNRATVEKDFDIAQVARRLEGLLHGL